MKIAKEVKGMKREKKAEKHLRYAREHLQYLREHYVERMRDPGWKSFDQMSCTGHNYYSEMLEGIRKEMEETKVKIARYERIVR